MESGDPGKVSARRPRHCILDLTLRPRGYMSLLRVGEPLGRWTWLPTATSVASYFDDFAPKTDKTLMKLTVLATI